jgi:ABC-type branched-subunit amino acid transport system permease subunit
MHKMTEKVNRELLFCLFWLFIYLSFCAVVDFSPHFGPASLPYKGTDPLKYVWNFGTPIPLSTYDPQSGFHDAPWIEPILYGQLYFLGIVAVTVAVTRGLTRKLSLGLAICFFIGAHFLDIVPHFGNPSFRYEPDPCTEFREFSCRQVWNFGTLAIFDPESGWHGGAPITTWVTLLVLSVVAAVIVIASALRAHLKR